MKIFYFLLLSFVLLFFPKTSFNNVKKKDVKNDTEIKYVIFDVNGSFWKPRTSDILFKYAKKRKISFLNKVKLGGYFLAHKMGTINFRAAYNAFLSNFKGLTKQEVKDGCNSMWDELCKNNIYKKAADIFNDYKSKNVKTIIASSSMSELFDDFLKYYKFDHVCSSRVMYKNGRMTGKLIGQPCAGKDKIDIVKNLIEKELGGSLNKAIFYFNSHRDIPLAKLVKKAVAFNPDVKLERYAKANNLQIIKTDEVQKASSDQKLDISSKSSK